MRGVVASSGRLMFWRSLRPWVVLIGVSGGGAAAVLAWGAWLPAWMAAVVAALDGVLTADAQGVLAERRRRRDIGAIPTPGASGRAKRFRVHDLADPIALGVHPAAIRREPSAGADRLPLFVRRDRFGEVLQRIAVGGFGALAAALRTCSRTAGNPSERTTLTR